MSEPATTSSTWRDESVVHAGYVWPLVRFSTVTSAPAWICSRDVGITRSSPCVDAVVVDRVDERDRQDTEVHEVLRVDAGEALGDHRVQPEVARRDRGVLAARALAVVVAADDDVAAVGRDRSSARSWYVSSIGAERESADRRDVAAERQHPRAGGQDLVGRDVVADLQQHRSRDRSSGSGSKSGSDAMFGPFTSMVSRAVVRRRRRASRCSRSPGSAARSAGTACRGRADR